MSVSTISNPTSTDATSVLSGGGLPAVGTSTDSNSFAPPSFATSDGVSPTQSSRSIRKQDVAEITAQLAIMTKSGVDLATSLASLASQCQRPALADILDAVREAVLAGTSFSEALKQHPLVFEPTFVATVAAGEASGRMAEVLQQLAQLQRKEIRSRRAIRSLLTYPVLLFLVSSSVLCALVLFVLPRFTEIFTQYEMPLPVMTQFLMAFADELYTRWWLWGPLVIGLAVGFFFWRKSDGGRSQLDRFWLYGPVFGEVCQGFFIGRTCRLLGLMLENGVDLLESLRLTKQGLSNTLYQELLEDLEDSVLNGQGLAKVLEATEIVPASAKEMLITAESTGNLGEVTILLGDYYEEESSAKTEQIVALLEPVITVVMGALVAAVVLAVMLPVFQLSTFASGGHG